MIFKQSEFVRILSGSWNRLFDKKDRLVGKVGQIHKVGDIDNIDCPYLVITVIDDETYKFMAKGEELKLLEYRQAEVELSELLSKINK